MKIVFCTQNMAPFRMRWMDEIAKTQEVIIYHLNEYEAGLNKKYISYTPKYATVLCETKKILGRYVGYNEEKILKEHADIYLLDGYGFIGQQHLIWKLTCKKEKFMLSVDGGFINFKENRLKKAVKTYFVSKASAYFSTSEMTDNFIEYYGGTAKKYRHHFSGLLRQYVETESPTEEQKKRLRDELGLKNQFIVTAVGKFEYRKGFDVLLKALEEFKGNICVCFLGSANWQEYEDKINKQNLDKIQFIDFCNQDTLKKYYMASDLMILPTREDIWGLVIPEAMANGIPVVTTERCLAGVAMLPSEAIIPVEDVEAILKQLTIYSSLTQDERRAIGNRNILAVQPYIIENAVMEDIQNMEDFMRCRKHE